MSESDKTAVSMLQNQVDGWLNAREDGPLMGALPPGAGALGADAADAKGVVSNACLIGRDMPAALAASKELQAKIARKDPDALEYFKKQPMAGCTSVMNLARVSAGFNPLSPDVTGNVSRFEAYTRKILTAPFFNLGYADSKRETRYSENWDELVLSVVKLFEGVEDSDRKRIKEGLEDLVKAAQSQSGTKQSKNLFVQNVLQMDGGTLSVFIYYSSIVLQEDKKKGSSSAQSTFTIARSKLVFRSGDWPYVAERVWNKQVRTIDDWLDDNTTPPGDQPIQSCFAGSRRS